MIVVFYFAHENCDTYMASILQQISSARTYCPVKCASSLGYNVRLIAAQSSSNVSQTFEGSSVLSVVSLNVVCEESFAVLLGLGMPFGPKISQM